MREGVNRLGKRRGGKGRGEERGGGKGRGVSVPVQTKGHTCM